MTCNTIARIPDESHPERSEYMSSDARVPDFIPYFPAEKEFTDAPDNQREHRRLVNWNFSNIVEDEPGSGTGWIFFEKVQTHGADIEHEFGTDVARISVSEEGDIQVVRHSEEMLFGVSHTLRCPGRSFNVNLLQPDEPRFGSISTLIDEDGYVYLLGGPGFTTYMARIKHKSDFRQRSNYEYFTTTGWRNSYKDKDDLYNVLDDQMHGAMFKCHEDKFAPAGRRYIWFGVNKWLDNKVWIACAERPEGPWEKHLLGYAPKLLGDNSGVRYCLYPHTWYGTMEKGEVLLSWTDNGILGGIVGLALYKFELEERKDEGEK